MLARRDCESGTPPVAAVSPSSRPPSSTAERGGERGGGKILDTVNWYWRWKGDEGGGDGGGASLARPPPPAWTRRSAHGSRSRSGCAAGEPAGGEATASRVICSGGGATVAPSGAPGRRESPPMERKRRERARVVRGKRRTAAAATVSCSTPTLLSSLRCPRCERSPPKVTVSARRRGEREALQEAERPPPLSLERSSYKLRGGLRSKNDRRRRHLCLLLSFSLLPSPEKRKGRLCLASLLSHSFSSGQDQDSEKSFRKRMGRRRRR